jgi:hypothetical protein
MARLDADLPGLTLYGPYTHADNATPLTPGVWYNVNDSGVIFKHWLAADWLTAALDYQLITGSFNWAQAAPPFAQSCTVSGCRVSLHCSTTAAHLTIEHDALDAGEQEA